MIDQCKKDKSEACSIDYKIREPSISSKLQTQLFSKNTSMPLSRQLSKDNFQSTLSKNNLDKVNTQKQVESKVPLLRKDSSKQMTMKHTESSVEGEKSISQHNSTLNNTAMEKRIKELKKGFDIGKTNTEEEIIEIIGVKPKGKRRNTKMNFDRVHSNRHSKNYETPSKCVKSSRSLSKNVAGIQNFRTSSASMIKEGSTRKPISCMNLHSSSKYKTPKSTSITRNNSKKKLTDTLKQSFKSNYNKNITKGNESKDIKQDTKRRSNYWTNSRKQSTNNSNLNKENCKPQATKFDGKKGYNQNSNDITVNKDEKIKQKNNKASFKKNKTPLVSFFYLKFLETRKTQHRTTVKQRSW